MQLAAVVDRLERVVVATGSPDATPADLKAALKATTEVESFVAAQRTELIRALGQHPTAFPEAAIADTSGCSLGAASKEKERAGTLGDATALADALSDGAITAGHVDALTRAARRLDGSATRSLLGDDVGLAQAASTRSITEFDTWIRRKAKQLDTADGEERLEQQRRATRLRVCQHHHTRIHQDGWHIELGPNRELKIELPDGQVLRTEPPERSAASRRQPRHRDQTRRRDPLLR